MVDFVCGVELCDCELFDVEEVYDYGVGFGDGWCVGGGFCD